VFKIKAAGGYPPAALFMVFLLLGLEVALVGTAQGAGVVIGHGALHGLIIDETTQITDQFHVRSLLS